MTEGVTTTPKALIELQRYVEKSHANPRSIKRKHGNRQSRLRGRGMDFAEVRHYQAGDEIRHMAWRTTARTGKAHIKLYEEEKERPVTLMVDFNPTMFFGTKRAFKSVLAANVAALAAWISNQQKDRVGGIFFSGEHMKLHTPKARVESLLPMLHDLAAFTEHLQSHPNAKPKSLSHALKDLKRVLKPGGLLVIISDFYQLDDEAMTLLARLRRHHDILAYHILDTLELHAPKKGIYPITDGEKHRFLHLKSKSAQSNFAEQLESWQTQIKQGFQKLNVPYHILTPESNWIKTLNMTYPRGHYG